MYGGYKKQKNRRLNKEFSKRLIRERKEGDHVNLVAGRSRFCRILLMEFFDEAMSQNMHEEFPWIIGFKVIFAFEQILELIFDAVEVLDILDFKVFIVVLNISSRKCSKEAEWGKWWWFNGVQEWDIECVVVSGRSLDMDLAIIFWRLFCCCKLKKIYMLCKNFICTGLSSIPSLYHFILTPEAPIIPALYLRP